MGTKDSLAVRLKRLRRRAGLTQEALAQAAGLTLTCVKNIEQGRTTNPSMDTLAALLAPLNADFADLVPPRSPARRL